MLTFATELPIQDLPYRIKTPDEKKIEDRDNQDVDEVI